MDRDTGHAPSLSAEAEQRRRAGLLAELAARRRKRRWTVGVAGLALGAVVITGSIVAWSSQARADSLASSIDAWHVEHDRAACELEVRIVSAVALEQRTEDVLGAAEHIPSAEGLFGAAERASFGERREEMLSALADGFVSVDDRAIARAWQGRAAAASDPEAFDVLGACLEDAEADRPPAREATPEQVGDLERELRGLGDARDFDDQRIDRLEAAIAQLESIAIALAQSRAELPALEASLALAPAQALDSVRDADARIREILELLDGEHTPADALELVEALALHVAAGWMAEAWQLDAQGQQEAAAARAAAAEASRAAVAGAAPRPITDRAPIQPAPSRPPLSQPPGSQAPGAPPPSDPEPTTPTDPVPDPAPSRPSPIPRPTIPPIEPSPTEPVPDPSPTIDPAPAPDPPALGG